MSIIKLLKSIFGTSHSPKWGRASKSQVKLLEKLIEINNGYRASPWTLDDWIENYFKGKWDRRRASTLIKKLSVENSQKRDSFVEKIAERVDRQDQETIFASDFSSYGFCPNSFYLTYRGYASRNLYELEQGRYYHGEYSKKDGARNQNSDLLHSEIGGIEEIKWFNRNNRETIYDKETQLAGIPDGLILFKDKELSIVELKSTRSNNLKAPYWGDVMQACAYVKIYKNSSKEDLSRMSSRVFIIYVNKEQNRRQLFEVDYDQHKYAFQSTLNKMQTISFVKELYNSDKNTRKCPSCGYRALCKKIVEKAA